MATLNIRLDPLLSEREVARIAGVSIVTVRRWRLLRARPRYLKIGSAVRYKPEDISILLESRPTGGGQVAR